MSRSANHSTQNTGAVNRRLAARVWWQQDGDWHKKSRPPALEADEREGILREQRGPLRDRQASHSAHCPQLL